MIANQTSKYNGGIRLERFSDSVCIKICGFSLKKSVRI